MKKSIYLYPGQFAFSVEPAEITTILGSCVGVALYDPVTKIGGLNHYLLAEMTPGEPGGPRYGSYAIPALIEAMAKAGADPKRLQAKVYGGGNVISPAAGIVIGDRNIQIALDLLGKYGIPVIDKNVSGTTGRRIALNTATFEINHRLMREMDTETDITGHRKLEVAKDIKVAIIDDSLTVRNLFQKIFAKHGLQVVGTAANPFEARELIIKTKPSVLTLDVEMPGMSGVAFLERLMAHMPTPTIMVSSLQSDGAAALRALDLGAIEFVTKPSQFDPTALAPFAEMLVEKVRAAASVNVIKQARARTQASPMSSLNGASASGSFGTEVRLVAIGGNSGSQESLGKLLSSLAADTPPVVVANAGIAQFLPSYIERLKKTVHLGLKIAQDGQLLTQGTVYFAPAGAHISVRKSGLGFIVAVKPGLPILNQLPSASVLFESILQEAGGSAVGILLGGYGNDGVEALAKLRDKQCLTIVENPEQSSFPYIPQKAIAVGAAEQVLNAGEIGQAILGYRSRKVA